MRPVRLVIDGVNSFKTRQTLDFSVLSSDLFCVYGDTGAGKSTVLDSMILALYGECNRGDDVRGREFVNLERDKAEVEFEFVMEGARYTVWREFAAEARRGGTGDGGITTEDAGGDFKTKKGEPKKRVKLFKDGELVTTQPTEAAKLIEEIVGLNRHDFTQVVVLEQGRFSRFLSSTSKERSTTVSKLLKLDRFKDLYYKTDRALSGVKNKKENIQSSVLAYAGHTSDALKELEKNLKDFEEKAGALDKDIERVSAESKRLETLRLEFEGSARAEARKKELLPRIAALKQRMEEAERELKSCVFDSGEARKERDKLALELDRVLNLLPRRAELLECGEQLESARKRFVEQNAQFVALQKRADEVKSQRKECSDSLEKLKPQFFAFLDATDILSAKTAAAAAVRDYTRVVQDLAQIRAEFEKCEGVEKMLSSALFRFKNDMEDFLKTHAVFLEGLKKTEDSYEKILDRQAAQRVALGLSEGDICPVCGGVFSGKSSCVDNSQLCENSRQTLGNNGQCEDERAGGLDCESKSAGDGFMYTDNDAAISDKFDSDNAINGGDGLASGEAGDDLEIAKSLLDEARADVRKSEKNIADLDTLIKLQLSKIEGEEKKKKELLVRICNSETEQKRFAIKSEGDCEKLILLAEKVQTLAEKHARLEAEDDKNGSSLVYLSQTLDEMRTKGSELKSRFDKLAAEIKEKGGEDAEKRRDELTKSVDRLVKMLEEGEKKQALLQEEAGKLSSEFAEKNKEVSLLEPLIKSVTFDSEQFAKTEGLYRDLLRGKSALSEQKGAVLQRLSACKDGIEKRKTADAQLKELGKKEDRLDTLKKLFRGDRFLEFITDEYIGQFAADASVILSSISGGKYSLGYEEGEGRFFVTDYLSGGKMRAVSTLSGGEMFLASLSLASAVARHISLKSYDFFFLDEGFGTLDVKRMDMVADALVGLSRCGMVGVISHRRELTERISARVKIAAPTEERGSEITIE